ncbi:hypothetical protein G7Y89_g14943 [Cudoniella acicularis]|uniref:DOC domain-containing protein n=1 Tax=Cudoniella acicularis TaxID=354080 RepID=A0A8H4VSF8_9HELO|nr:hypothetical protein G7Y89_g14943 [Cudoniella acicularis]
MPVPPSYSPIHNPRRIRRPRNGNPYDASHNASPTSQQEPVTPLVDEGADDEGHADAEVEREGSLSDDDDDDDDDDLNVDDEEEGDDDEFFFDEEAKDEDEEGGIQEVPSPSPFYIFSVEKIFNMPRLRPTARSFRPRLHVLGSPDLEHMENIAATDAMLSSLLANQVDGPNAVPMEIDHPFDPAALGLKEIGNLASWTVSSSKPGCGVEALRDEDTNLFWQSDGPQPHHLNIHFSRLVSIRSIRIFLDFNADESYTPTRTTLLAGTGYHDLIPFSSLEFERPIGWIDVPLDHVGGGDDGKTLRAFLVQVKIVENHQNGKDTHVRGLKVFARDERAKTGLSLLGDQGEKKTKAAQKGQTGGLERTWLIEPDWMGDPELR